MSTQSNGKRGAAAAKLQPVSTSMGEQGPQADSPRTTPIAVKRPKVWSVQMSTKARRTTNPIRAIVDKIMTQKRAPIPGKPTIPLSLGDPCAFGNLSAPDVLNDAMVKAITEKGHNGYGASAGSVPAREAIAARYSRSGRVTYAAEDVIIASGCSGALEIVVNGMLNEGDNMLVPRPGFPLYQVLAEAQGACVKHYDLLAARNWQADLEHMERLIDGRTKCILVNNPSNPCGSVYPREHLAAILAIAERHLLPVIADEIYAEMCFPGFEMVCAARRRAASPALCPRLAARPSRA